MKIIKTNFKNLCIIKHDIFKDNRGFFKESFRKNILENFLGYKLNFVQENIVKSKKNILRGLHYQQNPYSQSKLITVTSGEILDVVVDLRKNSKTYSQSFIYKLSSQNN